ncbi:hypothetical protein [Halapricum hydrolyticum]|uniref:RCK C-terminal domain-containing protein n=1 Tax=Halapricum hydrolyticum TaxID=2979991 RepID=A0AAE3IAC8_9EURY|nr:hypothetical protein [Halapricum hydrolyticum]MCU4718441.1 hypothetical protein [Halapricum hydrolyticum]MCU4726446.1 hypothetical protein [Halapricum hydrolyticum]
MNVLQLVFADVAGPLGRIAGLAVVAGLAAAVSALGYRWYVTQRAPTGAIVLVGLGVVAAYLNTQTALGQVIDGAATVSLAAAAFNIGAVIASAGASVVGHRAGDRMGVTLLSRSGMETLDDLTRVVRAGGRVITVELPDEIDDIVGYEPVDPETKEALAGQSLLFPRGLTVAQLRERLVARLKADYGIGHVDIELDDGTATHLAVGRRIAGLGPTLPPESVAMAIRADPSYAAGPGDLVQIWSGDGTRRRCNAELRATSGEVVTVAVDAADVAKLDPDERYRLVTLATDARPDREFVSLLRAADETMGVVEIDPEGALAGTPVGALDVTVVAVVPAGSDGGIETLPSRDRVLDSGESIYVIAAPDELRAVEIAAAARAAPNTGPS